MIVGVTFTVIVGAVPLNEVPSERIPDMVPTPVTVRVSVVLLPLHIAASPLKMAVGLGFTVTVALPVLSEAIDVQEPFVKLTMV